MNPRTASCLLVCTLAVLPACDVDETSPMTVRSVSTTADGRLYSVELDEQTREVLTAEREAGGRVVVVTSAGVVRAAAWTDGETVYDFDVRALAVGEVSICDATCPELDAVTAEILDVALDDALPAPAPDAVTWRGSAADKRASDVNKLVQDRIG